MTEQLFLNALAAFSEVRVLCVGDVMLDHYVYGEVRRISPEAPIPVLSVARDQWTLGGAGNVVRNLVSLGASVDFITVVGADAAAGAVRNLMDALPSCTAHVLSDPHRKTTTKVRYVAQTQQLLRVDTESTYPVDGGLVDEVVGRSAGLLPKSDIVILSDYAKGLLSGGSAQALIAAARSADVPVYIDPKGADYMRYSGATLVKPNRQELSHWHNGEVLDDAQVEHCARKVIAEAGVDAVLVTRGPLGMTLFQPQVPAVTYSSRARNVYDVSGAGDTAISALALGAAAGLSLQKAVELSCYAAGIVVGKAGTAAVTIPELIDELSQASGMRVATAVAAPM
jgi:D-beta-D-heptose 7-phosphate kinase/D-beta-D-heptose 1-phosphate adenosyltransferase